jgi:hypothetical protein
MKRKQKLQRRKKINRKPVATPQALTGNCRTFALPERENCLGRPTQILNRAVAAFDLSSFDLSVHVSSIPSTNISNNGTQGKDHR